VCPIDVCTLVIWMQALPWYLSDQLTRLSSQSGHRSTTSNQLTVRPSRLVIVGERSFAFAGPKLWKSLPDDITSALAFWRRLKTLLFQHSYTDIIM